VDASSHAGTVAVILVSLLGAAPAGAASKAGPQDGGAAEREHVGLMRTGGNAQDGGVTFNGFALEHPVTATGDRSKDDVKSVVQSHEGEISVCYRALLKRSSHKKPLPKGTVKLKFEVSSTGKVDKADVAGNIDEPAFKQCVLDHVQKWNFPVPRGGGSVKVAYPFALDPSDEE
jgi:TonB family protein